MSNISPFCTCNDYKCPMHPTNHGKGCGPCVAKNLGQGEIPSCFFKKLNPQKKQESFFFEDFAKAVEEMNGIKEGALPHMNCIVVFNKTKDAVLFCERKADPFKGRLNFVGGKVEPGESSIDAAYRELQEETGITKQQIRLYHYMDLTYYHQEFVLEMYLGMLEDEVELKEEKNPLLWLPLTEDFTDRDRFAGEQNIAHIINIALMYPIPE